MNERTIIRTIPRGPRGLRGNPPVPKWNGYFLSFEDEEGTPIGPAPKNLVGAQGPVGGSQVFKTRAQAMASSISVAFNAIEIQRYDDDSPLAPALYGPGTSAGPLAFQDVKGDCFQLVEDEFDVAMFGPVGSADDSDTIERAIAVSDAANVWLNWRSARLKVTRTIAKTLSNPLKWRHAGATITYVGAGDIVYGLQITLVPGVEHRFEGAGLSYNGAGKVSVGMFFLQPTLTLDLPYVYAERLHSQDCQDPSGGTVSAAAVCFRGGYRRVTMLECAADNLVRRVGSSSGMTGLLVMNHPATDVYPLETLIIRPRVSGIIHDDGVTAIDMDAIGVFANPDISTGLGYSRAKVIDPRIDRVWGRHIKFQTMHAEVDGGYALLNSAPSGYREMPVYAQQAGTMTVSGGEIVSLVNGASLVNFNSGDVGAPIASTWERTSVRIDSSKSIDSALYYDLTTTKQSVGIVRGVRILGELREFAWLRTNGKDKDRLVLNGVVVDKLTESMVRVTTGGGSGPWRGNVEGRNCVNTGTVRPFLKFNISGNAAEATLDGDSGCVGFTSTITNSTLNDTLSGIALERVVGPDMRDNGGDWHSGSRRMDGIGLDAGESYLLPQHGANGSCIVWVKVHFNDKDAYAIFSVDDAGFAPISVGASFNVGGSADPGSGIYRIWREDNRLRLQNNGSGYRGFTVMRLG